MPSERIQKVLAAAGCGPRRACEEIVLDGRVTVNGEVVRTLPVMVDPERDRITVDGKPLRPVRLVYFILNKPSGVFCTQSDPEGRKRAVDLLVGVRERVFPVGRLDADSTGLLLLTNDGDLAQHLTHPRYGVPKTYHADVAGCPTQEALDKLRTGVWLAEGKTAPAVIKVLHRQRDKAVLEITIREGRNREVRRMLAKLGHRVRRLTRVRMGKLTIRGLPLGAFRHLSREEVAYLRSLAERADAQVGAGSGFSVGGARPRPARRPAARGGDRSRPARSVPAKHRRRIIT